MVSFYGTTSSNNTARWHPEPTFRGTSNILSSCLITMALCIWTALHLNIPEFVGRTVWIRPQTRRKIVWLLGGLLAPELIAWIAFEQYTEASYISKRMQALLGQQTQDCTGRHIFLSKLKGLFRRKAKERGVEEGKMHDRNEWTMTHSHYVAMGGFALDVRHEELHYLAPKYYKRFTLTTSGFQWTAKHYLSSIPDLSLSEIQDKSKASSLAKFLVCVQALWFCVQCIYRLTQGLSICLLELNTFAHAICALLSYVFWWDKPLDIEEPTTIQMSNETSAVLLVSGMNDKSLQEAAQKLEPTFRVLQIEDAGGPKKDDPMSQYEAESPESRLTHLIDPLPETLTCFEGMRLAANREVKQAKTFDNTRRFFVFKEIQQTHAELSRSELMCLRMAILEEQKLEKVDGYRTPYMPLSLRKRNWPAPSSPSSRQGSVTFTLFFAGVCYGGIHASAWNAPFPSSTQRLLWRISSLTLASTAVFVAALYSSAYASRLLMHLYSRVKGSKDGTVQDADRVADSDPGHESRRSQHGSTRNETLDMLRERFISALLICTGILFWVLFLFYLFCRAFLVVESFISLSHLPESALYVPSWSRYFPHIG